MNARNIASISALTPVQEGILFHVIREPGRRVYHSQFCATIEGPLDASLWRQAWELTVARHETLRTLFTWEGRDKPLQIVREHVELPWQTLDWRTSNQTDPLRALLERDRDLGFDLERAPLFRCILIATGEQQHRFVLSFHHLILDGWSMRLVLADAQRLYTQLLRGETPDATPAPPFTRFIEWLAQQAPDAHDAFWREQLGDFTTPVFPEIDDGIAAKSDTHGVAERTLDAATSRALTEYARSQRVTLSSTVSAAWALLLQRYAGRNDVVFGATVAGRPPQLDDVETTAGMFINTLPLRVQIDETQSVADYVSYVHAQQVALRSVEHAALAQATRCSGVEPGSALFESIVVFENFPAADDKHNTVPFELTLDEFVEYSHFPLALLVVPDDTLRLILVTDPQRMQREAAQDLLDNFETILQSMINGTAHTVGALSACGTAQREQLVHAFNQTQRTTPNVTTLWDQIAAKNDTTPDHVAVIDGERTLTYAQLVDSARRVASGLIDAGVPAGSPVAIMAAKDAHTIAGVLGILAAGCAYVPLGIAAPPARTEKILTDLARVQGEVCVIVGDDCPLPDNVRALALASLLQTTSTNERTATADDLAYVIYTSGSTGTPKGVAVTHGNLYHSVDARDHYYQDAPDAFALLSTLATDSSVAGLFWTLGRGGTLVLPAERAEQDMPTLLATLRAHDVSHLLTVPSLYGLILEHLDGAPLSALRVAIVAGEACPAALVSDHEQQQSGAVLHNEYGPTEATVWCSATPLRAQQPVTIGGPIANTRLYVVDDQLRVVPVGVAGELCIGGAQVALGYLGDPQRTAERFVPSPFVEGDRLYRTGDRVRWQRDGNLVFIGRVDAQLKVRGFRVEPGDIEACLETIQSVHDAVVVLHQPSGTSGSPRLVAWLNGDRQTDTQALRAHVAAQLPAYMVPQHFEWTDTLPHNAAGKIDRLALATRALQTSTRNTHDHDETRSPIEQALLDIWQDVLGTDAIGIHDDFFTLGGDSLLSIRILARAGKAGLAIAPKDFFANPTIASLAVHATTEPARRIKQTPVTGTQPLLPIQHWFFDTIGEGAAHWNMSWCFDLHVPVTRAHLQRAIVAIANHHDALRSRFESTNDGFSVDVGPPQDFDVVSELDLQRSDPAQIDAQIHRHADTLNTQFDLSLMPLLRLCVVRTPASQPDRLLIVAHHLIMDAESWRIVLEDLATSLDQLATTNAIALPAKTDSLITWATRLNTLARDPSLVDVAQVWVDRLASAPADDGMPQLSAEQIAEQHVRYQDVTLDRDDTQALLEMTNTARASVQEMLLAAVTAALASHSGRNAVSLELEGHGREALFDDVDISRTVGWMTTAYPIVVSDPELATNTSAALRAAKSALRDVPHNGLSYSLLRHSNVDNPQVQSLRNAPRARTLLNYLGQKQSSDEGPLRLRDDRCGQARAAQAPRAYLLEINAYLENGRLWLNLAWPQTAFDVSAIEQLAGSILASLRTLGGGTDNTAVPEDFPLANLDQQGLSDLSDLLDDLDDVD